MSTFYICIKLQIPKVAFWQGKKCDFHSALMCDLIPYWEKCHHKDGIQQCHKAGTFPVACWMLYPKFLQNVTNHMQFFTFQNVTNYAHFIWKYYKENIIYFPQKGYGGYPSMEIFVYSFSKLPDYIYICVQTYASDKFSGITCYIYKLSYIYLQVVSSTVSSKLN